MCGWFDVPQVKYAQRHNGCHGLILTKIDALDSFDEIKICTGYVNVEGNVVADFPLTDAAYSTVQPVYITLPGWQTNTTGITYNVSRIAQKLSGLH